MAFSENNITNNKDYRSLLDNVIEEQLRDLLIDVICIIQSKNNDTFDIVKEYAIDNSIKYNGVSVDDLIKECLPPGAYELDKNKKLKVKRERKVFPYVEQSNPIFYHRVYDAITKADNTPKELLIICDDIVSSTMDTSSCLKLFCHRWLRDEDHTQELSKVLNIQKRLLKTVREMMFCALDIRNNYCGHKSQNRACTYDQYDLFMHQISIIFSAFEALSPRLYDQFSKYYNSTINNEYRFDLDKEIQIISAELALDTNETLLLRSQILAEYSKITDNISLTDGILENVDDKDALRQIIYKQYYQYITKDPQPKTSSNTATESNQDNSSRLPKNNDNPNENGIKTRKKKVVIFIALISLFVAAVIVAVILFSANNNHINNQTTYYNSTYEVGAYKDITLMPEEIYYSNDKLVLELWLGNPTDKKLNTINLSFRLTDENSENIVIVSNIEHTISGGLQPQDSSKLEIVIPGNRIVNKNANLANIKWGFTCDIIN